MLTISQIKMVVAAILFVMYGGAAYYAGSKVTSAKYETEKVAALKTAVEQIKETQESDQQVVEQRAESTKVVTRTIVKVQREIIKLPVRDCGFTHDERMSINVAYCANFPDAAFCLSNSVPTSNGTTGSGG